MLSKARIYNVFVIVTMALFCLFTYTSMRALGFEEFSGSFGSIVRFVVVVLGAVSVLMSRNEEKTEFVILWSIWEVWLILDLFLLGLRAGGGSASIFYVLFAPMTFLLFYHSEMQSQKTERMAYWGFVVLFVLAFYMNISNLAYRDIDIGEETGISNLVYWCLCAVPFLFLSEKRWLQVVFLLLSIIIVLLTSKRSATISIMLIAMAFLFYSTKDSEHMFRNLFFTIVAGVVVWYIIDRYFKGSYLGIVERMSNMKNDQGTGRIPLYKDVFAVMKQNSFIDWLVGRGYGSITITRHTNAHNDALQLLFEYGFVGLLFYVMMLYFVIKRTITLKRGNSLYYMGHVASLMILLVLGAVSNLVVFYSYFAFICAYWGIVEAKMVQANQIKRIKIVS